MASSFLPHPPEDPVELREFDGTSWTERYAPLPKAKSLLSSAPGQRVGRRRAVWQSDGAPVRETVATNILAERLSTTRDEHDHDKAPDFSTTATVMAPRPSSLARAAVALASLLILVTAFGSLAVASKFVEQRHGFGTPKDEMMRQGTSGTEPGSGVNPFTDPFSDSYIDAELDAYMERFVVPPETSPLVIVGTEPWLKNCAAYLSTQEQRVEDYDSAVQQLRISEPQEQNAMMEKVRQQVAQQRDALIALGVIDGEFVVEPGQVPVLDTLEPLRGNWVGYAFFAYITADSKIEKSAAFLSFLAAVNTVTASIAPGGDQDRISSACAAHLERQPTGYPTETKQPLPK